VTNTPIDSCKFNHNNNSNLFYYYESSLLVAFRAVRYEDIMRNPKSSLEKKVLPFFGYGANLPSFDSFIDTHTKRNEGGPLSTKRNSTEAAFRWASRLFPYRDNLQVIESEHCKEAMQLWGYLPIHQNRAINNSTLHFDEKDIISSPPWPEMNLD
jgi:hypothetical protein